MRSVAHISIAGQALEPDPVRCEKMIERTVQAGEIRFHIPLALEIGQRRHLESRRPRTLAPTARCRACIALSTVFGSQDHVERMHKVAMRCA